MTLFTTSFTDPLRARSDVGKKLLRHMFRHNDSLTKQSVDGKYIVELHVFGVQKVVVDDFIPCVLDLETSKYKPAFTYVMSFLRLSCNNHSLVFTLKSHSLQSNTKLLNSHFALEHRYKKGGDELWPMLIEKALAKVYGSYNNLDGGRPSHGFQDLVGYPIRYINCRNERFQMILDIALKAQVPVVTFGLVHNTGKFPDDATRIRPFVRKRMLAMYSRHSYSVLSMFEHENKTYVKLRNPHGRNIMWRRFEKSAILTADERESGEFCLEISQFRRWFTEYVVFFFLSLCRFFFSNTSTGVLMHGYL